MNISLPKDELNLNVTLPPADSKSLKEPDEQIPNSSLNNAVWLGFEKTDESGTTLPYLVRWNIIYILAVTLWTVINIRQFNYRVSKGIPAVRTPFMFPRIKYTDADKSLKNCLKYLVNFGYYKFGVEVNSTKKNN